MQARGIDIHTHVVPSEFPAYAGHHADIPWPSMRHASCGHAQVMISGKVYRDVTDQCWNTDRRQADMQRMDVARQVLSPMPELLSYWFPPEDAATFCKWMNERISDLVGQAPDRFVGLGMVPLQDVEAATVMLESIVGELGLAGVEIGTHVNGRPIGDPAFAPFFSAAERLGAAIFVHALHPAGKDRLVGPPMLEQVVAFPCETALSIASLITGGVLNRHPGLKIAFSHGGGAFAMVLPRLQFAWQTFPALREQVTLAPRDAARRLYYDTLVYDDATLRYLIDSFGERQLMLGTDYPFAIQEQDPCGRIAALGLNPELEELLLFANAERFLTRP